MLCTAQALRCAAETLIEGVSPQPALPQPSPADAASVSERVSLRAAAAAAAARPAPPAAGPGPSPRVRAFVQQPVASTCIRQGSDELQGFRARCVRRARRTHPCFSQPVKCPKQGALWAIRHALTLHRAWANQSRDVVFPAEPNPAPRCCSTPRDEQNCCGRRFCCVGCAPVSMRAAAAWSDPPD